MSSTIRHIFFANLWRRRLPTSLSVLAIALGVALGLAVQLIHTGALDEFRRGVNLLNGQADAQVLGGESGFDDRLYAQIARLPEVAAASPILQLNARLPGSRETLRIVGVDPLRLGEVNPSLMPMPPLPDPEAGSDSGTASAAPPDPLALLREDAIFLSAAAAKRLGLSTGDPVQLQAGTALRRLRVAGEVPGAGVGADLAVMDIAAAQLQFGRVGVLTRIDLRLHEDLTLSQATRAISDQLPPGLAVLPPERAASESLGLTRAYRVNLTMLAGIALLTGGFLVFSTQWLAVVRRRQELAFLRAVGLSRAQLWQGLLAEGAILGLIGALLGTLLAYLLAAAAFAVLDGDLGAGFFRGVSPRLQLQGLATLVYLLFGLLAGLAGAWLPAREAVRSIPARALKAGDEAEAYRARPRWWAVLASAMLALVLCVLPPIGGVPVFGYVAVVLILGAGILALPGLASSVLGRIQFGSGPLARLALARLRAAPGQTLVAGAGVVASVALAASMAVMVDSFRGSVDAWLERMLPADLYLRASDSSASGFLAPAQVEQVRMLPSVRELYPTRFNSVRLAPDAEPVSLIARRIDGGGGLPLVAGELQLTDASARPAWISEAFADQQGLSVGEQIQVPLGETTHAFTIAGIWRDYARQQGSIVIRMQDYRALSKDTLTNDLGLMLTAGADPIAVMAQIHKILGKTVTEMILPSDLRAMVLRVFDRTFLITYLMEGVAVLIGLFGVATTFAALATSRRKEFGILRHLGLRRRDIGALMALEAALGAALAVLVGLLAGGAIALVLIEVVNRQSFHWSMDITFPGVWLMVFSISMVALAAGAARVAGAQAMRQDAVLAVREDW